MFAHDSLTAALDELDVVSAQLREGRALERTTRFYDLLRIKALGNHDLGRSATVIELNNGYTVVTWLHDPTSLALYSSILSARRALCADGVFLLSLEESSDRRAVAGERPNPTVDLSEVEKATLLKLGQGLSNKEIAAQLGVTLTSVKERLARAYRKLGVEDRMQAALLVRDIASVLAPGTAPVQAAAPEVQSQHATVESVRRRKDLRGELGEKHPWRGQGPPKNAALEGSI